MNAILPLSHSPPSPYPVNPNHIDFSDWSANISFDVDAIEKYLSNGDWNKSCEIFIYILSILLYSSSVNLMLKLKKTDK